MNKCKILTRTVLLIVAVGCGGPPAPPPNDAKVEGLVTLKSKPIGPLTVHFYSMLHGNVAESAVDANGKFHIDEGIPVGEYALYLSGPASGKAPSGIPSSYFIDTATDQRFELEAGMNKITMDLKR